VEATVVAVCAAASVVLVAQPAQADSHAFIRPVSWAYTDSAAPNSTFTGATVDARVGSWTDSAGGVHTSRSYFTWDLSAYRGATVNPTGADAVEKAVNNCASERRIHLWETPTPTRPITWNNPPAEQRIASTSPAAFGCPAAFIEFDVTDAVRHALRGTGFLTLEVRVPADVEGDVAFGRSLANSLAIQLNYNHAPNRPFDLRVNEVACGPDPLQVNSLQPRLRAKLTDPDVNATGGGQDSLSAIFQVWPVGQPEQVTEVNTGIIGSTPADTQITVPAGVLADGGKYVYKVKANDGQLDSKPSVSCRFNVDVTRPTNAPTVTSTDYPAGTFPGSGGPGIPGTFTFSAGGDKDITGFSYGQFGEGFVAADRPGGTATVAITPTQPGQFRLSVTGVDRAHNFGPSTTYTFWVNNNAPQIRDSNPQGDGNQPRTFTFGPGMDGVVAYVYQFNNGAETTVVAGADATASVTVSTFSPGFNTLTVRSVTATGYRSYEARYGFYLPSAPTVRSDQWTFDTDIVGAPAGTTGTITFTPVMGVVTSYTWNIGGLPETVVAAAADGTATVSYTPTEPGYHFINVVGHTANGDTEQGTYYFVVGEPVETDPVRDKS
jgi:hypothetical protein